MEVSRFISRDVHRLQKYMDMIHTIGNLIPKLSNDFENLSDDILDSWEEEKHKNPTEILFESKDLRKKIISEIIRNYQKVLKPKILDQSKFQNCINIIRDTFNDLFEISS